MRGGAHPARVDAVDKNPAALEARGDFGAFRLIPVSTSAPHLFLVAPDLLRKNFEIKRILGLASRLLAGDDLASVNSSRSRPFISDVKPQPCLEIGVTSGGIVLAVLFV